MPVFIDLLGQHFSQLLLVFLWISAIIMFNHLPAVIPTHFNFSGEVDSFGSKYTIFLLPLLGTILFIVLSILCKHPEKFNYLVKITPANAQKQYGLATRLVRWLNVSQLIVFTGLLVLIYFSAIKAEANHALLFSMLLASLVFVPLVKYLMVSLRQK